MRGHDAGHILGSSWLELTITENGKQMLVVFSGDLGRYSQPILNDPEPPTRADFLLCESTYGDRDHPAGSVADELAEAVNETAKRGGAVVIPAFAVGRTQLLMYYLRHLESAQRIPRLPVFVDSPMAINVTGLYENHHEDHDLEFTKEESDGNGDPLNVHEVHMTRTVDESKKINSINSPCVIISASGMATGGRILHHLARRLPDSRNTVLLVGYQAEGSRGRALEDGAKYVRIFGDQVPVRARVVELGQLRPMRARANCCDGYRDSRTRRSRLFWCMGNRWRWKLSARRLPSSFTGRLPFPRIWNCSAQPLIDRVNRQQQARSARVLPSSARRKLIPKSSAPRWLETIVLVNFSAPIRVGHVRPILFVEARRVAEPVLVDR